MTTNATESANEALILSTIKARFCKYVMPGVEAEKVEVLKAGWERRNGLMCQVFEIQVDGKPVDYYPYALQSYKQALKGAQEIKIASIFFDSQPKKR
jgi:hypothetical protein